MSKQNKHKHNHSFVLRYRAAKGIRFPYCRQFAIYRPFVLFLSKRLLLLFSHERTFTCKGQKYNVCNNCNDRMKGKGRKGDGTGKIKYLIQQCYVPYPPKTLLLSSKSLDFQWEITATKDTYEI